MFYCGQSINRRARERREKKRKEITSVFYCVLEWEKRAIKIGDSEFYRCMKDIKDRLIDIL